MKKCIESKFIKYFIVTLVTAIFVVMYLIYYRADFSSLIALNENISVDSFVTNLLKGVGQKANIFQFCEYNLQNVIIYLLTKGTNNAVVALNMYYLCSFLLIAVLMFILFQKVKCSFCGSLFGSILLSFLPYHIERGQGQIITSSFYVFIIFTMIVFELFIDDDYKSGKAGQIIFFLFLPWIDIRAGYMLLLMFFILCIVMGNKKSWKTYALCEIVCLLGCIIITFLKKTSELQLNEKLQLASEEGMRTLDMLVPVRYHIVERLFNFRYDYDMTLNSTRECGYNSMGFLISTSFLYGLFVLLFKKRKDNRTVKLAWINIFVILIANIDGFGYLFEYSGFQVEYWNRMAIIIIINSVMIMIFSMERIQNWIEKKSSKLVGYICAFLIYVVSFLDIFLRHSFYFG